MLSLMMYGARVSLIVGFAAAARRDADRRRRSASSPAISAAAATRADAHHRLLPGDPRPAADDRRGRHLGPQPHNIILIIGSSTGRRTARVVRAQVKSIRERGYIRRTRVLGASNTRLILRHVLPQVAPLLVATAVIMVAYAIFAETAIAFLGLGDPSATSWGLLIENAFSRDAVSVGAWWAIVPPGIAVAIVVVSLTMLGTAIEDVAQPAPAREPRLGAPLPAAPGAAARGRRVSARAGARGAGPARLVRAPARPRAARGAGRRASRSRAASAWASWASRAAARRRSASR